MKNRTRTNLITIYLSDEELELLNGKTKLSKFPSVSAYIRHMIRYGFVYSVDYHDLQQYNWYLSNIANNLNQIAHKANSENQVTNEEIHEAKELIKEVWQLQKSMLSKQPYINL